jgi:hypothetical protein
MQTLLWEYNKELAMGNAFPILKENIDNIVNKLVLQASALAT